MKVRSKWLGVLITLFAIISMALVSFTSGAHAAPAKRSVSKHTSAIPKRCKSRDKAKGQAIYSDVQFPDNLNPYQTTSAVSVETYESMFDSPTGANVKGLPFADMLTKVPTLKNHLVKNGGKEFIFKFKKGMLWSNGAEITAADLKFGQAIGSDAVSGPLCSGSCDVISRIDVKGKYEADIFLKHVDPVFIISGHYPPIWPRVWSGAWNNNAHDAAVKLFQDQTFNFEGPNFPTSGPYRVSDFSANDRITLVPNPKYDILNCGAHIAKLIFSFYSNNEGMIAAAAKHETNVTQDYTLANSRELLSHRQFHTIISPAYVIEHLELNHDPTYNGHPNPLSKAKVRDALALAVNKLTVLQSALQISKATAQSIVAYSFLINTKSLKQPFVDKKITGQWDPVIRKYIQSGSSQAIKDAKTLLKQAGYGSGITLDFQTTTAPATRLNEQASVCASWLKIGVNCTPLQTPSSKLFANWAAGGTLDHGQFQVALFAFLGSPDPDGFKYDLSSQYVDRNVSVHADINGNYSAVSDGAINKAFKQEAGTLSTTTRQADFNTIQLHVNQNADWIPLYYRPVIATTDGHVKNVTDQLTVGGPEWDTFAWHL